MLVISTSTPLAPLPRLSNPPYLLEGDFLLYTPIANLCFNSALKFLTFELGDLKGLPVFLAFMFWRVLEYSSRCFFKSSRTSSSVFFSVFTVISFQGGLTSAFLRVVVTLITGLYTLRELMPSPALSPRALRTAFSVF